jgi:hypothetical protein
LLRRYAPRNDSLRIGTGEPSKLRDGREQAVDVLGPR